MKKLVIGFLALASFSTFASTSSDCVYDTTVDILLSNIKIQEYRDGLLFTRDFSKNPAEVKQAKEELKQFLDNVTKIAEAACK